MEQGLRQFLLDYTRMRVAPSRSNDLVLRGTFDFRAAPPGGTGITDEYDLEIVVLPSFPRSVPRVTEISNKIPRHADYHIYPTGELCLASPLQLLRRISRRPDLSGFAEDCIVPYLYAVSHKLRHGGPFCFGELGHTVDAVLSEYAASLRLGDPVQVLAALELLGMKRRLANKKPCPCGCGRRLGKCRLNLRLSEWRKLAGRAWFRNHATDLRSRR